MKTKKTLTNLVLSSLISLTAFSYNPMDTGYIDNYNFYTKSDAREYIVKEEAALLKHRAKTTKNENYNLIAEKLLDNIELMSKQAFRDFEKIQLPGVQIILSSKNFESRVQNAYLKLNENFQLDPELNQAINNFNTYEIKKYIENQNLSKRKDLNSAQLELLNKYSKTINSFLSENYETFSQKSLSLLSNYDFNTLEFKQFNDIQYNTVDLMYKKSIGAYNDTIDKLSQSPFESKIFNQVIGLSNSMFGFFNKLDKKYGVTDNFKFIINKIETYVNDQNKKRKEKIQLEFIDEKAQYNGGDLKYKFHIDRDSIFQKMF